MGIIKKMLCFVFTSPWLLFAVVSCGESLVPLDTQVSGGSGSFIAPSVVSIEPQTGSTAGGLLVNISGETFSQGIQVFIGDELCLDIKIGSNSLSCITPPGDAGAFNVRLKNVDYPDESILENGFTYIEPVVETTVVLPAPTLINVSPSNGSIEGGTALTLIGTGFVDGINISLENSSCTTITFVSSTKVECITSRYSKAIVSVMVQNMDGKKAILNNAFTYLGTPIIKAISPSIGILSGQFTVNIIGLDFQSDAEVLIGESLCINPIVTSTTLVTCTAPSHTAGTYSITITNGDGKIYVQDAALRYSPNEYQNIELFAGSRSSGGFADGAAENAKFYFPRGVTSDGLFLYVADYSNHLIRKIDISTGVVTTVAGQPRVAGGVDGIGNSARFYNPTSLVIIGTDLYVTDYTRHVIRKIDLTTAAVTTFAGTAGSAGITDGVGAAARFYNPTGIATDGTDLFVTTLRDLLRKVVVSTATVSTIAGIANSRGSTNGVGGLARFYDPQGLAISGTKAFVTDGNHTIREVDLTSNTVVTVAGSYGIRGSEDAASTVARFNFIYDAELVGTSLFIAESGNNSIRKMDTVTHEVTTFAGISGFSGSKDGVGASARFRFIRDGTILGDALYVTDTVNCLIRKIELNTGTTTTIAGVPGTCAYVDGIGSSARLGNPWAIANDGTYLYFTESGGHRIRRVNPSTGEVITIAGSGAAGGSDNIGVLATFNAPRGIACDGINLYIGDYTGALIRKIVIATNAVTTIAGSYTSNGSTDAVGLSARFYQPSGFTLIGNDLYVIERAGSKIRKIDITSNTVTSIAGFYGSGDFANGIGSLARFDDPEGITNDGKYLYVADFTNHSIRKIDPITGLVETILGNPTYPHDSTTINIEDAKIRFPLGVVWSSYGLFSLTESGIFRLH